MHCTHVVWLEADALYAFKGGGFGYEVGVNDGLGTPSSTPTPTDHLQLKVSQIVILV